MCLNFSRSITRASSNWLEIDRSTSLNSPPPLSSYAFFAVTIAKGARLAYKSMSEREEVQGRGVWKYKETCLRAQKKTHTHANTHSKHGNSINQPARWQWHRAEQTRVIWSGDHHLLLRERVVLFEELPVRAQWMVTCEALPHAQAKQASTFAIHLR